MNRGERGTMAALSALLKTWVILQTLCLALAQVVSERGKMRPVLFSSSVGIKAPGKVWRAGKVWRWCYRFVYQGELNAAAMTNLWRPVGFCRLLWIIIFIVFALKSEWRFTSGVTNKHGFPFSWVTFFLGGEAQEDFYQKMEVKLKHRWTWHLKCVILRAPNG